MIRLHNYFIPLNSFIFALFRIRVDLLTLISSLVLIHSTRTPQSHHTFGVSGSGVGLVRSGVVRETLSSGQCTGILSQETSPREPWALAGEPEGRQMVWCVSGVVHVGS